MECYCTCILREFKIFFHPAKFDNFKDKTISDYETVSVPQSQILAELKTLGLVGLFILCEIHSYFYPHIFWVYYFSLSQSERWRDFSQSWGPCMLIWHPLKPGLPNTHVMFSNAGMPNQRKLQNVSFFFLLYLLMHMSTCKSRQGRRNWSYRVCKCMIIALCRSDAAIGTASTLEYFTRYGSLKIRPYFSARREVLSSLLLLRVTLFLMSYGAQLIPI